MNLNHLPDEVLKNLIHDHLLIEVSKNKSSDSYFSFEWDCTQSQLIYQDIDLNVHGNSCWEDSKEEKTYTQANHCDIDFFGEFFTSFFLQDFIIHKQFENNITDEYLYYLDNYKSEYDYACFIYEEYFNEDYDAYYNYNRVRKLTIRMDEILNYIKSMPFVHSLDKVPHIFTNLSQDKLTKMTLFSDLNDKLPEKNVTIKKMKI